MNVVCYVLKDLIFQDMSPEANIERFSHRLSKILETCCHYFTVSHDYIVL